MDDAIIISGRYRVTGLLGAGTFSDVYKADDTVLDRKVTLKVLNEELSRDPGIVARFTSDARTSTELVGPNITHVLDVGTAVFEPTRSVSRPFVVRERVPGIVLDELIGRGPVKPADACRIASEIMSGLEVAHEKGVFHVGVNPSNVMISTSGTAKISDIGLSAGIRLAGSIPITTEVRAFIAPEVLSGAVPDARADVFSVGAVLFTMLTGTVPFAQGYAGSRAPAVTSLNPRVPAALNIIVAQSLEPDPRSRFTSVREFRDLLERASSEDGGVLTTSMPPAPASAALSPSALPTGAMSPDTSQTTPRFSGDLPPTERMESVAPTTTDTLVSLFGRNAVTENTGFESSLPEKRRRKGRVALGLTVSLVFVVAISVVTLWVLNIKPVDFFPSSSRAVPNVVGFDYQKAAAAVTEAGLTPVRVDEPNAKVPLNSVIRVDPDAGKKLDIGTRVTLYVSSGLSEVQIPNVSGMSVEEATAVLKKLGLVVGSSAKGNSATIAQGLVISTSPAVGSPSKTGASVGLVVSSGQVTIPDLTGKKIDEAASILGASDIMITPSLQADTSCRVGADGVVVTSQSVAPGDVPAGTPVTLTYCAG